MEKLFVLNHQVSVEDFLIEPGVNFHLLEKDDGISEAKVDEAYDKLIDRHVRNIRIPLSREDLEYLFQHAEPQIA